MTMKYRKLVYLSLLSVALLLVLSFSTLGLTSTTTPVRHAAAQAPTPTPNDPAWLGFVAARAALEEKLQQEIAFVKQYLWVEGAFPNGQNITDCATLPPDAPRGLAYFGYRYGITLLNGKTYEVRTSYDYTIVVVCDGLVDLEAAQRQIQGGGNNANLPAPVAGSVGPGGLEVGGQVTGLFDRAKNALNQAGMKWVKIQINNSVGYDTAVARINEAHGAGYKILLSVVGDIPSIMDPNRQNDFANYVGSLAKAGADAIEVWNEPNIDREWPAGQISGVNYTQLLAKAYNAIKQNNPNTIVISAAPAPTGFFGAAGCTANGCNDDVFYQQMAQAGAGNYMDCVGVHYNEGIVSPTQSTGDPRDNYPTRYYQSNLGRALGPFPGKQACFTEIGYLSGEDYGSIPAAFNWAAGTSIAEHAQWLGEAVRIAKSSGNVRLMIVFNVDFTTYTDDPQAGYAIIRKDGSCPACSTIKSALSG
jgi:hypothetical protein